MIIFFHHFTDTKTKKTQPQPLQQQTPHITLASLYSRISLSIHITNKFIFFSLIRTKLKKKTEKSQPVTITNHSRIPVLTNQSFGTHNKQFYLFHHFTDEIRKKTEIPQPVRISNHSCIPVLTNPRPSQSESAAVISGRPFAMPENTQAVRAAPRSLDTPSRPRTTTTNSGEMS